MTAGVGALPRLAGKRGGGGGLGEGEGPRGRGGGLGEGEILGEREGASGIGRGPRGWGGGLEDGEGASGEGRGPPERRGVPRGREGSLEDLEGAVTNRLTTHPRNCFHKRLIIFEKLAVAKDIGKLLNTIGPSLFKVIF